MPRRGGVPAAVGALHRQICCSPAPPGFRPRTGPCSASCLAVNPCWHPATHQFLEPCLESLPSHLTCIQTYSNSSVQQGMVINNSLYNLHRNGHNGYPHTACLRSCCLISRKRKRKVNRWKSFGKQLWGDERICWWWCSTVETESATYDPRFTKNLHQAFYLPAPLPTSFLPSLPPTETLHSRVNLTGEQINSVPGDKYGRRKIVSPRRNGSWETVRERWMVRDMLVMGGGTIKPWTQV